MVDNGAGRFSRLLRGESGLILLAAALDLALRFGRAGVFRCFAVTTRRWCVGSRGSVLVVLPVSSRALVRTRAVAAVQRAHCDRLLGKGEQTRC